MKEITPLGIDLAKKHLPAAWCGPAWQTRTEEDGHFGQVAEDHG